MPRALEIVGLSMRKSKRIEHVPNALSMIQEATARPSSFAPGCYLRRSVLLENPGLYAVDMIIDCATLEEARTFGMTDRESNSPSTVNDMTAWYSPHQDLGRNRFRDFSRYRVGADIFLLSCFLCGNPQFSRLGPRQRSSFGSRARWVENRVLQ